jgi:zinc D-Ala-D-Ala dipeptidase
MAKSATDSSSGSKKHALVLIGDARIAAIPVTECGEPFIDFHDVAQVVVDDSRRWITSQSRHFAKARITVVNKLVAASYMLPVGIRLKIIEAYRPLDIQRVEFESHRSHVKKTQPQLSDIELDLETSRFSAPPHVAPHPTGAAVDLTLCDAYGRELDLGTAPNAIMTGDATTSYTDSAEITDAARKYRALLVATLIAQGLVNYPTEWWHWSYGDRYWAFATKHLAARYGPREEEELN